MSKCSQIRHKGNQGWLIRKSGAKWNKKIKVVFQISTFPPARRLSKNISHLHIAERRVIRAMRVKRTSRVMRTIRMTRKLPKLSTPLFGGSPSAETY